jgi:hypothetical protein
MQQNENICKAGNRKQPDHEFSTENSQAAQFAAHTSFSSSMTR